MTTPTAEQMYSMVISRRGQSVEDMACALGVSPMAFITGVSLHARSTQKSIPRMNVDLAKLRAKDHPEKAYRRGYIDGYEQAIHDFYVLTDRGETPTYTKTALTFFVTSRLKAFWRDHVEKFFPLVPPRFLQERQHGKLPTQLQRHWDKPVTGAEEVKLDFDD